MLTRLIAAGVTVPDVMDDYIPPCCRPGGRCSKVNIDYTHSFEPGKSLIEMIQESLDQELGNGDPTRAKRGLHSLWQSFVVAAQSTSSNWLWPEQDWKSGTTMTNKRSAAAVLLMNGLAVGAMIGFAARAQAEPYPNCPFTTHVVYDICSDNPGVPGVTPGFTLQEGIPGTWGPRGMYTPIQKGNDQ